MMASIFLGLGFFFILPLCIGAVVCAVAFFFPSPQVPSTILFHSVGKKKRTGFAHYPSTSFALFISHLASTNTQCLTVCQATHVKTQPEQAKKLVITFDDGFSDFYENALPILSAHDTKATIFPVVGYLGRLSDWDVYPSMMHLSKDQLREIASLGHEIGSHTMTHADLTLLADKDLRYELYASRIELEDILGASVVSLSFPGGNWNARVIDAALDAGYTCGTMYRGNSRAHPSFLPATGIYSIDTMGDIMAKVLQSSTHQNAIARERILPHFAKGAPLWLFRDIYDIRNRFIRNNY